MKKDINKQKMSLKKPLVIYLADMVHNFIPIRDNWMIPLSALLIASYTKAAFKDLVEIRVFKFPDLLLKALKKNPPDIIGLSNYCWNLELNKVILNSVKRRNGRTVTVMGGPNITPTESRMTEFLKSSSCDYYVIGPGEEPFKRLVKAMLGSNSDKEFKLHKSQEVHGVWYLDPGTKKAVFKATKYEINDLDEIPSPFQNGMAKEFLEDGLIPMIETQRGCPFQCTYCSWDSASKNVYKYSIERMRSDIDYCRRNSKDDRLMINDPNFGLLGDRDLEIAQAIRDSNLNYGWPGKVIINWGQTKSDIAFKAADILKGMTTMRQSSQSLDAGVLKNINRKSISDKDWKKFASFCKANGIESFGELIIPLPRETLDTYLSALRYFFDLGLDCINTNTLMLLEGAPINAPDQREKYGMHTGFRLMENCYGLYDGRAAVEYQEMVMSTGSFSLDDFFACRQLNWLIQMSWTMRQHDLLLHLLLCLGVNPVDFFIRAIRDFKTAPVKVRKIFEDFISDMRKEFFPNKETLVSFHSSEEKMKFLRKGGFRKLNTHYSSRVLIECNKDFIDYYKSIALEMAARNSEDQALDGKIISECAHFLEQRYIKLSDLKEIEAGKDVCKNAAFHYDIARWIKDGMQKPLSAYHHPAGFTYRFFINKKQGSVIKKYMQYFSGISGEYQMRKMQEPYQGIDKKYLIFCVEYQKNPDEVSVAVRVRKGQNVCKV